MAVGANYGIRKWRLRDGVLFRDIKTLLVVVDSGPESSGSGDGDGHDYIDGVALMTGGTAGERNWGSTGAFFHLRVADRYN